MRTLRWIAAVLVSAALFAGTAAFAASNEAIKRNNFGAELVKQGRLDEAVSEFRAAVSADPRFAAAQMNLAYTYERLGREDEAIAGYKKTVELEPRNAKVFNNLAVLYMKKNLYDEAIQTLEQGLTVDPTDTTLQKNLEIAKANRGMLKEREARLADAQKQAEDRPKDPRAAYQLARVYASLDRQDQAFEWLGKALQMGFDDIRFVREDPVLSALRPDPRFAKLLEGR